MENFYFRILMLCIKYLAYWYINLVPRLLGWTWMIQHSDCGLKRMCTSPLKIHVDGSAPNLAQQVSSLTWSATTIFWAIGLRGFDYVGDQIHHFPISRLLPSAQCWCYHTACDYLLVHPYRILVFVYSTLILNFWQEVKQ